MSQADELLNGLSGGDSNTRIANPDTEPHIVIDENRHITVPDELKRIAVQYDHNIETVTFDCPRYWDDHDLSQMAIYINYLRSDGYKDNCLTTDVIADDDIVHFNWTISRNVSANQGGLVFLVCAKTVNDEGNEELHWNSELCKDLYVSEGMEVTDHIVETNSDIITQILSRLDSKQDKLVAGDNIVIDGNIISATGGGSGIVVDTTYNPDSYNAQSGVALSKAFYTKVEVDTEAEKLAEFLLDGMVSETLLNEELSKKADLSNKVTNIDANSTDEQYPTAKAVHTELQKKQEVLTSGENIKTINGKSILGSGDIVITGGEGGSITVDGTFDSESSNAQSGVAIANFLFTNGKNLFNPNKCVPGKRADGTGSQTDILNSELIPVEPETTYSITFGTGNPFYMYVVELDENEVVVTKYEKSNKEVDGDLLTGQIPGYQITTNPSTKYLKCSPYSNASNENFKKIMIEKGSEMTSYEPYKEYIKTELIEYDYSEIESEIKEFRSDVSEDIENMEAEVNGLLVHGKNLYNPENDVYAQRAELNPTTGTLGMGSDYNVRNSEWIPAEPSTTYFVSHTNISSFSILIAEKDADGNILTSHEFISLANNDVGNGKSFTTQPTTAFLKCSVVYSSHNEKLQTIMIEKNSICTEYEPYKKLLDYRNLLPLSMQNPWIGKRLVVDGDSITHAFTDGGSTHSDHYFWQFVVAKLMGMNLDISRTSPFEESKQGAANGWRGIGGSTIANEAGCNDVDVSVVLRYEGYPDDADVVIIACGTNDWAHGSILIGDSDSDDITTFNGALNTLLPGLKEKYPTIPIIMMTPIKRGTRNIALNVQDADGNKMVDSNGQEIKQTQKQFVDALIEKCREYGVYCCDMWSNCRLDPNIQSMIPKYYTRLAQDGSNDLVHPDKAGQEVMGKTVAGFLKTIIP